MPLGIFQNPVANAQTAAPKNAPDAGVRFQNYLNTFAKQNHWFIVAEGAPLSLDESFSDSMKFQRAAPEERLQKIADAADYDVLHEQNAPIWVLTKRYSSPREMPCVTLGECAYSLQKLASLTAPLLPESTDGFALRINLLQGMYRSFTPEQRKMMQPPPEDRQTQPNKPLPVANVPAQKRAAQEVAAALYIDDFVRQIQLTSKSLAAASQARLKKPSEGAGKNKAIFWANDNAKPNKGFALGNIGWLEVPEPGAVLPPAAPTTLGKEVARISTRQQADKQIPCEIDPALADKLLTVAGTENVDAVTQLKAFADVYDLRLRTTTTARVLGFRPNWKEPVTLLNLREAVAYTLPPPYARILTGKVSEKAIPKSDTLREFSPSVQRSEAMNSVSREAIKQLHLALDAPMDAAGEKGLPVSEITPFEQPALAGAALSNCFPSIARLMNTNIPDIVTHMDDLYVVIKKVNDEKSVPKLQMTLYYKDPDGSLHAGGGVEGIPVPEGL